jgi:Ankyrin repeats (many copies)
MVHSAIKNAQYCQHDGARLHLDEHVDSKGNTLLHIVGDPAVLKALLRCDSEVNATNERGFTALMVASKYGRVEMVRTLFGDPRVDILAKELRGLTAVELAKDDDVRNRIDGKAFLHYVLFTADLTSEKYRPSSLSKPTA